MRQWAYETPAALVPGLDDGVDNAPLRLYALEPLQKDRRFEATALGPYILAWEDWLEVAGRAPKTLDNYERDMATVAMLYPHKAPEDFTPADLISVAKKFPERARRIRMEAVKSFFKWAILMDVIDRNPFEKVPSIRQQQRRFIDVFSDAEVDDLLNLSLADAALMGILFETGLRKAEARMLQVRRIRLEGRAAGNGSRTAVEIPRGVGMAAGEIGSDPHGELVVIAGKGGKDRTVQFGSRLHGLLQDLLYLEPMNPMDYLWYTRPGAARKVRRSEPVSEAAFRRWWERNLEAAGVRYRNPHTTRHTYATRWLKRGGRLENLSRLMGHSSIAITADAYGHLDTRDVLRDLALMEAQ